MALESLFGRHLNDWELDDVKIFFLEATREVDEEGREG